MVKFRHMNLVYSLQHILIFFFQIFDLFGKNVKNLKLSLRFLAIPWGLLEVIIDLE